MQTKLSSISSKIYFFYSEVQPVFKELKKVFNIKTVFSHQEIGNKVTFDRDIAMQKFFNSNQIYWKQSQMHGVIRRLKSRSNWDKRWEQVMRDVPKIVEYFKSRKFETQFLRKIKRKRTSKRHHNTK